MTCWDEDGRVDDLIARGDFALDDDDAGEDGAHNAPSRETAGDPATPGGAPPPGSARSSAEGSRAIPSVAAAGDDLPRLASSPVLPAGGPGGPGRFGAEGVSGRAGGATGRLDDGRWRTIELRQLLRRKAKGDPNERSEVADESKGSSRLASSLRKRAASRGTDAGGTVALDVRWIPFRHVSEERKARLASVYAVHPDRLRGSLRVAVERGIGLHRADKAQTYVRVAVRDSRGREVAVEETKVDPETPNPLFLDAFAFSNIDATCKLQIDVCDGRKGLTGAKKVGALGSLTIPVGDIVAADSVSESFMLRGVPTGQLKCSLDWITIWPEEGEECAF